MEELVDSFSDGGGTDGWLSVGLGRIGGAVEWLVVGRVVEVGTSGPISLGYASPPRGRPVRVLALLGISVAAVVAGTVVGASTNAVNGAVSPAYFVNVMGWQPVSNIWLASVLQGALEGSVVGVLFSAMLTITIGIVTKARCEFGHGVRWLGYIVVAMFGTWSLGGACGAALAAESPSFFQNSFIGVPSDHLQMLRYAWVGGSIWGAEFGGLGVVVIGLVLFGFSWRRMLNRESGHT